MTSAALGSLPAPTDREFRAKALTVRPRPVDYRPFPFQCSQTRRSNLSVWRCQSPWLFAQMPWKPGGRGHRVVVGISPLLP